MAGFIKTFFKVMLVSLLLIVILLSAVVTGLYFGRHILIEMGIERGGNYALGTATAIDSSQWDVTGGRLTLFGLQIENPQGFDETPFLTIDEVNVHYEKDSWRRRPVEIKQISLQTLHVYLDHHENKANYEVILNHIQTLDSTAASQSDSLRDENLKIHELLMEDIHVSAAFLPVGGELSRCDYAIRKIKIKNPGGKDQETMSTRELYALITKALFSSVLNLGGKILPGPIRDGLGFALGPVFDLAELGVDVMAYTVEGAVDVVGFMGKTLLKLGQGVVDAGKAIIPGVGQEDSVEVKVDNK